jgi:hypothetical protein
MGFYSLIRPPARPRHWLERVFLAALERLPRPAHEQDQEGAQAHLARERRLFSRLLLPNHLTIGMEDDHLGSTLSGEPSGARAGLLALVLPAQ